MSAAPMRPRCSIGIADVGGADAAAVLDRYR
jgi:hypothetical protein